MKLYFFDAVSSIVQGILDDLHDEFTFEEDPEAQILQRLHDILQDPTKDTAARFAEEFNNRLRASYEFIQKNWRGLVALLWKTESSSVREIFDSISKVEAEIYSKQASLQGHEKNTRIGVKIVYRIGPDPTDRPSHSSHHGKVYQFTVYFLF